MIGKYKSYLVLFISILISFSGLSQWIDLGDNEGIHVWYKFEKWEAKIDDGDYIKRAKLYVKITNNTGEDHTWNSSIVKLKIPYKHTLGVLDQYEDIPMGNEEITVKAGNSLEYDAGRIKCKYPNKTVWKESKMQVKSFSRYLSQSQIKERDEERNELLHSPQKIEVNYGMLEIKNATLGDKLLVYIDGQQVSELKFRKRFSKTFSEETTIEIKVQGKKNGHSDSQKITIKPGYKYFFAPNTKTTDFSEFKYSSRLLELWNEEEAAKIFGG